MFLKWVVASPPLGLDMHNRFALLYQKTAYDYMSRLDPDPSDAYAPDYMFYVR